MADDFSLLDTLPGAYPEIKQVAVTGIKPVFMPYDNIIAVSRLLLRAVYDR